MSTPISISLALQPSLHTSHTKHTRRKPRTPIDTRRRHGSTASSTSSSTCSSPFCNSPTTQNWPTITAALGSSSTSQAPNPPTDSYLLAPSNKTRSTVKPSRPTTTSCVSGPCSRCISSLAVPLATSSGTTATSLVNATTIVRRERPNRGGRHHGPRRRERSNTLISYLMRSRAEQSTGVRASTPTASAASRFISSLSTLSSSSSLNQSPLPRPSSRPGQFAFALPTFPTLPPLPALPSLPSFPSFHYPGPSILSRFSYTSSSSSPDLTPRSPHNQTGSPTSLPRTRSQSSYASRGGSSVPHNMDEQQDPSVLWKAFAQFKQQVIDSHHYQQWESMTEQWQWHLWYRESVFEEHEYDQERDEHRQQHHYRSSHGREREQLLMNQHDCARIQRHPLGGAQRAHHLHPHPNPHPHPYPHSRPHPHPHPHPRTKAELLSDQPMRRRRSNRYDSNAPENIGDPINNSFTTTATTTATATATKTTAALESTSIGVGDKVIEAQEEGRKRSDGLLKKDSRGRFGFESRVVPTLSTSDLAREDHPRYQDLEEEQYQQRHQQQQHSRLPMVDHGHLLRSTTSTGPWRGQNCIEDKAQGNATSEKSRHHSLHVDISLPIHTTLNSSSSCFHSSTPPASAAVTASAYCTPFDSFSSFSSSLLPSTSNPTLPSSSSSSPSSPIDSSSSPTTNSPTPSSPSSTSTHADTMPGTATQPSIFSSTPSPLSPKTKPCPHSTSTKLTAKATTTTATATTSTARAISSPSIASLSGPYAATTAVLTSSLQRVRSAGERGRHLAQRSRSNLNRFLGVVVEATSTLSAGLSSPTSQESHRDYHNTQLAHGGSELYDKRHEPMCTPSVPTPSQPPQTLAFSNTPSSPPSRQLSARAKFFVCEEDSDDESEDEVEPPQPTLALRQLVSPVPSKGKHPDHPETAYCEVSSSDQEENEAEEEVFEKKSVFPQSALQPSRDDHPDMGRRQSLLSDLFMAEKMRASQQRPSESTTGAKQSRPNVHRHMSGSKPLSRCHSAANSDGESSHAKVAPTPELYPTTTAYVHHHHNRQYYIHHEGIQAQNTEVDHGPHIHLPKVPRSGLTRTKKSMFKNLDELALMASTNTSGSPTASPGRCSPLSEQGTRIQNRLHLQTQNFHSPPRRYSHVPMSLKV